MQPYFFPYIGYFQLLEAVDLFVVYDNIKYTKKGWINRNRILRNGKDVLISIPLKKDSDSLDIRDREIAGGFKRNKLLNQIKGAYALAPQFSQVFPLLEKTIYYEESNLFRFLLYSIENVCDFLGIQTEIRVSSSVPIDHNLKRQDKVIALCNEVGAGVYINSAGGAELYSKDDFISEGIDLKFLKPDPLPYNQFGDEFVPWLSVIDVMMFAPVDLIRDYLASKWVLS